MVLPLTRVLLPLTLPSPREGRGEGGSEPIGECTRHAEGERDDVTLARLRQGLAVGRAVAPCLQCIVRKRSRCTAHGVVVGVGGVAPSPEATVIESMPSSMAS